MQAVFPSFFINSLILEVHLNTYCNTEFVNSFSVCFNCFFWSWVRQAKHFRDVLEFLISFPIVVLRPCSCLRWTSSVVTDNIWKQDSICTSVNSVVNTTNLVGHWVAHTKEGIGEGHTSHCRRVVHFLTSFWVSCLNRFFQPFKDKFDCLKRNTICIVVSEVWSIGFSRVSQDIHTCISSDKVWNWFNQSRVNNGNSRCQWVVSQWVFAVVFLIRDNGKWCYFWTSTWSCWDTDVLRFLTKWWEAEGAFTNIHEFLDQVTEVDFWLFVEEPHYFGCIHWWTTTKSNDCVWFECFHHLSTTFYSCDVWIWFNIWEDLDSYTVATCVQLIDNTLNETEFFDRFVCNNQNAFNIFTCLKVLDRIAFEVNFWRNFKPLHIISTFPYFLDV